ARPPAGGLANEPSAYSRSRRRGSPGPSHCSPRSRIPLSQTDASSVVLEVWSSWWLRRAAWWVSSWVEVRARGQGHDLSRRLAAVPARGRSARAPELFALRRAGRAALGRGPYRSAARRLFLGLGLDARD